MPQTVNLRYDSQTRLGRPLQFNEMNSALRLRLLKRADLAFADSVRALAGWNQTMEDWERFLSAEPDGCFLAEWNGASAGTATTTVYERELAWIGMVLVHPEFRRRGIGRALLERCIEYLRSRGVRCIKLDATPLGEKVYAGLGFKDEWTRLRPAARRLASALSRSRRGDIGRGRHPPGGIAPRPEPRGEDALGHSRFERRRREMGETKRIHSATHLDPHVSRRKFRAGRSAQAIRPGGPGDWIMRARQGGRQRRART